MCEYLHKRPTETCIKDRNPECHHKIHTLQDFQQFQPDVIIYFNNCNQPEVQPEVNLKKRRKRNNKNNKKKEKKKK